MLKSDTDKKVTPTTAAVLESNTIGHEVGDGGELHQVAGGTHPAMRTQGGVIIHDDENQLKAGERGPSLAEDHFYLEKTQHFDHERIPERIVHARGYGARGYFELTDSLAGITKAKIFNETGTKTPVFTRFSTVAGNMGSFDAARDVRGFAVKFYTSEGNWDLVGNNIPVFFIQDAIKFTDLIHSVKQEPDRGFPQAASAHDTFWDFASLTPESTHMLMWVMSDRGIPRSFRMMEGFGIHTFRLINDAGESTYVKFHWRPKLGTQSLIWDEAVKINGADPDFHRRDLWESIEAGNFPEWELAVQLFDQAFADKFDFDILDSTKLIPEEILPLRVIGRMVLDRNVDNYFAETEQVAFCVRDVVPGIDFTNDPLLQGRILSYVDTQISRLGGPNYKQIPVNQPKGIGCPVLNMQRDGAHTIAPQKGRVSYSPSSLEVDSPRQDPSANSTFHETMTGDKRRVRAESFGDHFSQALQFFNSQTETEQNHIIAAFIFELSKVETLPVRERVVSQLANVDQTIADRVAAGLGMKSTPAAFPTGVAARTDLKPSPALSILAKAPATLKGRKVGCLVADGTDLEMVKSLKAAAKRLGADFAVIAPKVGGATSADGKTIEGDFQLAGGPSVLFDTVFLALSEDGAKALAKESGAVAWVSDAFAHLKVIGTTAGAQPLLTRAGVTPDAGLITDDADAYLKAAAAGRTWDREPNVRTIY
ncbi:catalase [Terriglobus roseus DSM 18391]|uniref:Catalase n=1 Tax=Terriglobus roseus (strain DSM 18391 / NRRL B-41598 / KBS 63) TaxID=926566 RepID=I3ZI69_TERRK|nr:catalase [Terriglobus roseus]AFL88937.1 catalase [Terriglobus roseus DSM 18391]